MASMTVSGCNAADSYKPWSVARVRLPVTGSHMRSGPIGRCRAAEWRVLDVHAHVPDSVGDWHPDDLELATSPFAGGDLLGILGWYAIRNIGVTALHKRQPA